VRIVTCPIVREPDGLALSSRNRYLSPEERVQAVALRRAVLAMDEAFTAGRERNVETLLGLGKAIFADYDRVWRDYLEVRDPEDLTLREGPAREGDLVAVAARVGRARLIDNGRLGREGRT